MEITLKQAHRLDLEISQLINEIYESITSLPKGYGARSSTTVSIYEDITLKVENTRSNIAVNHNAGSKLIIARYELRDLIAKSKNICGINSLLCQEAAAKEILGRVSTLNKLEAISKTDFNIAQQRLEKLLNDSKAGINLNEDTISINGILDTDLKEFFDTQVRDLKKQITNIKDLISALNNTTKIILSDELVSLFKLKKLI